jgi:hypothetical protein
LSVTDETTSLLSGGPSPPRLKPNWPVALTVPLLMTCSGLVTVPNCGVSSLKVMISRPV